MSTATKLGRRIGLSLATCLAVAGVGRLDAQEAGTTAGEVYADETVTILIGHPPGGSYDLYAQLAAAYWGDHLPGAPEVIVQHMPGGDGRQAAAFFVNRVEPDGLTVAILPPTLGHLQLLTPEQARWEARDFRYVGRFAPANSAFAVRTDAAATTVEEMRETETIVGCIGRAARSAQQSAALNNVGGLRLRNICGYSGSNDAELAAVRGEVDMFSQNWASFVSDPTHLDSGALKVVMQAGLERDPDLPDVPLLHEVAEDPEGKRILRFVSAGAPIGRSMMAHPGTPDELLAVLRDAFRAMVTDPAFLEEAERRQAIINPADGDALEAVMDEIMAAPPELVTAARDAMDASDAESTGAQ